jgi:hypothetical protein
MKWKAQNKAVSKVTTHPTKYPGERLHIDASGSLPPMERKRIVAEDFRDEVSGLYFMAETSSTTPILKRQLQ